METFPKFIIEGDNLIIQKCTFHKELISNEKLVKGGGWFRFINETNVFVFYGGSHDYGKASYDDIKTCFENKKIFSGTRLTRNISEKFNFAYDNGEEIINL